MSNKGVCRKALATPDLIKRFNKGGGVTQWFQFISLGKIWFFKIIWGLLASIPNMVSDNIIAYSASPWSPKHILICFCCFFIETNLSLKESMFRSGKHDEVKKLDPLFWPFPVGCFKRTIKKNQDVCLETRDKGLGDYALIFSRTVFGILARGPKTFYKNYILPSWQV